MLITATLFPRWYCAEEERPFSWFNLTKTAFQMLHNWKKQVSLQTSKPDALNVIQGNFEEDHSILLYPWQVPSSTDDGSSKTIMKVQPVLSSWYSKSIPHSACTVPDADGQTPRPLSIGLALSLSTSLQSVPFSTGVPHHPVECGSTNQISVTIGRESRVSAVNN